MPGKFIEGIVEEATLEWFEELGYTILHAPDIAPDEPKSEREAYVDVVLLDRLRVALETINTQIPLGAIEEAIRKVTRTETPNLYENNRRFHKLITDGVDVEYQTSERVVYDKVKLIDFTNIDNNDWLAVNQFTVIEDKKDRRPDVVIFINGLPLAVIELKNPTDKKATIRKAFEQLQTYKQDIPCLFPYNEILVVSDGTEARAGTLTADWERFMPWRTIEGDDIAPKGTAELEVLIKGIFEKHRILYILKYFIVFEVDGSNIIKKMAGYHQYHAVNKAIESTIKATSPQGDKRVGVVWHTQGSGKSLTMAFYAGKIIQHPVMENPTLVVLTDRNDLDEQLYSTFAYCSDLLRQNPVQAQDREDLKELLEVASGGVVFTTIQKFAPTEQGEKYPLLSNRRNIVFIADEAHRSQYGLNARVVKSKDDKEAHISYGFAKYLRDALPNASFIGFTGTPIEQTDINTRNVFGEYIDIYNIQRAVEDEATVPIYYEGRIAKIELNETERPKIDPDFEDVTEDEEQSTKEKLKTKWARLAALVGADKRITQIAKDIVEHFERRQEIIDGKAMIVCMSRQICVDLYNAIIKLRPDWHDPNDDKGTIKIVMTGSAADGPDWQQHIRSKSGRKALAKRFKDPADSMKLVIVRDMWLTGFDAPCLHTIYIDKPMRGHGLMQAIARVNRVFKDKPGGLVVDYLGIGEQLKQALNDFTQGDKKKTGIPQEEVIALMRTKYETVREFYQGFDYSHFFIGTPSQRVSVIPRAMNHILEQPDGKQRYMKAVNELSKAFALCSSSNEAINIRDELGFFQAIRAAFAKSTTTGGKSPEDLDTAIREIVSNAVASNGVVDIFAAAGIKNPNISIFSDSFLEEVRNLPTHNLALELLQKLINDEIQTRSRRNLIQSRSFSEMLEQTVRRYQNRTIEAAQVIAELVELAHEMREAYNRGDDLGLSEDELAFYDALDVDDTEVALLGDETLRAIARELVQTVRRSVTIDWTQKESVRAKLRTIVKRLLRKYGYPPDKQEKATLTVLQQAELLCKDWAA